MIPSVMFRLLGTKMDAPVATATEIAMIFEATAPETHPGSSLYLDATSDAFIRMN
jgi:hypothetical protein